MHRSLCRAALLLVAALAGAVPGLETPPPAESRFTPCFASRSRLDFLSTCCEVVVVVSKKIADFQAAIILTLAERLGMEPGQVLPQKSFQQLGVSSLGMMELVRPLEERLGRPLSPTVLWAYPSPAALAQHLSSGAPAEVSTEVPSGAMAREPMAVVGLSCRLPRASGAKAFWRLLREGGDAVSELPAERRALFASNGAYEALPHFRGAFLEDVEGFDPACFGISPREAAQMDPQQRLALELAWEALEDAGVPLSALRGSRTGVFVGSIWRDYGDLHRAHGAAVTSHTGPGQAMNIIANRVSYVLGLQGPSLVIDTACSSSLVAVELACHSLREGESTLALAGGVNLMLAPETMLALERFGGLSPSGRCRSFDAGADGYVRGEGGGMVVLRPLSAALAAGDRIYCSILAGAVNNDGATNGLTAPNPQAQEAVLRQAYARAGVAPHQVHYVEAHGTGTPLGDPIEAQALGAVLGRGRPRDQPLLVGSVKTNVGHLEGAAGIAGLIKVALCLRHRKVPASLHFDQPNPRIPFPELGLVVPQRLLPWPAAERAVAGVSSFGWGGTNCHLVLGELPPCSSAIPRPTRPPAQAAGRVWFICSPQGGQWPGMAWDLLHGQPVFRHAFLQCDELFRRLSGRSLIRGLTAPATAPEWDRADFVQPALCAFQIAMAELLRSQGIEPDGVVGHSLGEVAAARIAGLIDTPSAMEVIFHYSRLQERMGRGGGMAVVALPAAEVQERLAEGWDGVAVAGSNSPSSTLLSGDPSHLDRLLAELSRQGVRGSRIQVGIAAHGPAMEPLVVELTERLRPVPVRSPTRRMISTVTGEPLDEKALDPGYWARNLRSPVRFGAVVEGWAAEGDRFVFLDPHPVLEEAVEEVLAGRRIQGRVLPTCRRGEGAAKALARLGAELPARAAPGAEPRSTAPSRCQVVTLSARAPAALETLAGRLEEQWAGEPPGELSDLAYTTNLRRQHHRYRLAVVCRSREELCAGLSRYRDQGERSGGPIQSGSAPDDLPPGPVFAFCGQGAQWRGVGQQLREREPTFRRALEACDEGLRRHAGWSLLAALDAGDEASRLERTEVAQPALFALQVGLVELWRSWGIEPAAVVGHSVGEVAAAWAAGALSLEQALALVARRGRQMEALQGGAMASVALGVDEVQEAIESEAPELAVAAVNSPRSTVICGPRGSLEAMLERLRRRGVESRRLRLEYAFHGPGAENLAEGFVAGLGTLSTQACAVPMVSSVTGEWVTGEELDAAYWGHNLARAVQFARAVETLLAEGHRQFLEIGPHPVLSHNVVECAAGSPPSPLTLASLRRGRAEEVSLRTSLAALWARGQPVRWEALHPRPGRCLPLPAYPWQRQRAWFEAPAGDGGPAGPPRPPSVAGGLELGPPIRSPLFSGALFQGGSVSARSSMGEHRVQDRSLLPLAAYLTAFREAGEGLSPGAFQGLSDFSLRAPLFLDADPPRSVQVVVEEDAEPDAREGLPCRFFASEPADGGAPDGRWTLYATAHLIPGVTEVTEAGHPAPLGAAARHRWCRQAEELSGNALYRDLRRQGFDYGPAFRRVVRLWRRAGEALARIEGEVEGPGLLPPVLLDACLQAVLSLLPLEPGRLALPVAVESCRWFDHPRAEPPPARGIWSRCRITAAGDEGSHHGWMADCGVFDDQGVPWFALQGMLLRPASELAPARDQAPSRPSTPAQPAAAELGGEHPLRRRLEQLPRAGRRAHLLRHVQAAVAAVLDLPGPEELDPEQRLFEAGMDSMLALELADQLSEDLGCDLPASLTFTSPNVEAVTDHLLAALDLSAQASPLSGDGLSGDGAGADDSDVARMSEQEAERLLEEKLRAFAGRGARYD